MIEFKCVDESLIQDTIDCLGNIGNNLNLEYIDDQEELISSKTIDKIREQLNGSVNDNVIDIIFEALTDARKIAYSAGFINAVKLLRSIYSLGSTTNK